MGSTVVSGAQSELPPPTTASSKRLAYFLRFSSAPFIPARTLWTQSSQRRGLETVPRARLVRLRGVFDVWTRCPTPKYSTPSQNEQICWTADSGSSCVGETSPTSRRLLHANIRLASKPAGGSANRLWNRVGRQTSCNLPPPVVKRSNSLRTSKGGHHD